MPKKNTNWSNVLYKMQGFQSLSYNSPYERIQWWPPLLNPLDHTLVVCFHMIQGDVELRFRKSPQNKKNLYKLAVLTMRNMLDYEQKLLKLPKPKKA